MNATPTQPTDPPSPPIELVAIDLDGTLLRSDKNITRRTAKVVTGVMDKGVKVVLATARPPRSVREIHKALGLDTLVINYNGALIHDPSSGTHHVHHPLGLRITRDIIKLARRIDPELVVSLEILDKWYTDHVDPSLPTETSLNFAPDYVGPLEAILRTPVTKLLLLAPPDRLAQVHGAVIDKFTGDIALAISDQHLLQIIHPQADKGKALAWIAAHYGVPQNRTMAIGDALNDLGMIRWAGLGVAVGNAWDDLRKAAKVIVPSNDEEGVACALQQYVLV